MNETDPGQATLVRVTTDSPPALLEAVIEAEAVHPVASAADLAHRLGPDRRCYALVTPEAPDAPYAVVHVALTRGVPDNVQGLLDVDAPHGDPAAADTAVFWTISATPRGRGGGWGRRLIEAVLPAVADEFPGVTCATTLSPLPGFREWLESEDPQLAADASLAVGGAGDEAVLAAAHRYLTTLDDRGRPICAVARFHLGNGARLWLLRRFGDTSERGLLRSFGVNVHYRYLPEDRAANRAALAEGRIVSGT